MRNKRLIDLTVGDVIKLRIAWYFIKPMLVGFSNGFGESWNDSVAKMRLEARAEKIKRDRQERLFKESAQRGVVLREDHDA